MREAASDVHGTITLMRAPSPHEGPATMRWWLVVRSTRASLSAMAGARSLAMRPIASHGTTGQHITQPLPSSSPERARAPCHTPHARALGSAPGNGHQEHVPGAGHHPLLTRDENGNDRALWTLVHVRGTSGLQKVSVKCAASGAVAGALSAPSQLPAPSLPSPAPLPLTILLQAHPAAPILALLIHSSAIRHPLAGVCVSVHLDGSKR